MSPNDSPETAPGAEPSQDAAADQGQPPQPADAAEKPPCVRRLSPLRMLRTFVLLALVGGIGLGLVHLWRQAGHVGQLRFQVEQLAAAVLRDRGVLVTIEASESDDPSALELIRKYIGRGGPAGADPPPAHVVSVNFQSQEVDEGPDHHVSSDNLRHLAAFYRLQTLNLANTDVNNRQLRYIAGLSTLRSLVLGGTRVGDPGLEHLGGLTRLRSLHLPFTKVSDQGLVHLAGLPELSILDLSDTRVTDEGLRHLLGLKSLRHLLLANNQITDEGLDQLAQMKWLGRLTIGGTQITAEGVQRLEKAIPGITIDR